MDVRKYPIFVGIIVTNLVGCAVAYAQSSSPSQRYDDINDIVLPQQQLAIENKAIIAQVEEANQQSQLAANLSSADDQAPLSLSREQLRDYPDIVVRALIPALAQDDASTIQLILSAYKQQPDADPDFVQWGEAILAKSADQYAQAIDTYRYLISQHPEVFAVRFQLAQSLYLNHEDEAAYDQFEKLRAQNLDQTTAEVITAYIERLQSRQSWSVDGGINYVKDKNINNAPKANTVFGNWKAWDAQSAEGVDYQFSANKKWPLTKGYFSKLSANTFGSHYFDNSRYNEVTTRLATGVGYQNAKVEAEVMPFVSQRWYANNDKQKLAPFSRRAGVQLNGRYWLSNQLQTTNTVEVARQLYKERSHLTGESYFLSTGLLYIPKATQYWFGNINYYRNNADAKDDAFNRYGVRFGWGQEWQHGISTIASVNLANRDYLAAGRLLDKRQKNDEMSVDLTVWHRNVHALGFTPRLTFNYEKVDSNHPFYTFDKKNVSIGLTKQF
ncbi:surface lipoprotein assembly modifier [Psychrobacter lutiphocae]|uniref:surface lipoprotein assembly modifier n=1 Tax=Psychrobacter lutiphocae TaxID=540500 RepID=UPI0003781FC9|nr:surface lipoprotein assembly modifier [Psychrobacter lutiphocae]